ncbi:uncharacterized protein LOC133814610 [Humulus lupulus]|uniref:uncharacterized protein LOC133814610 n=1 Tax=Humulus lupulus TaxID=3486 RepID=UPI002B411505|nr:uncharacterized protein LOC133814610 [Humulus lupulus]
MRYLKDGTLPANKKKARRLAYKAARYNLVDGVFYKRGFSVPLLSCIVEEEGMKLLNEIHEGECENHASGQSTMQKAMRQGYYWPSMEKDASDFTRRHEATYKIIPDNDTQIEGGLFEDYYKEKGIKRSLSAVVNPQANGQVEAINKVLKKNLKT